MIYKMIQNVGDRDNPSLSIKDIAFTINANPMSDRLQKVIEVYETQNNCYMEGTKKVKTPRPAGKGWCWDEENGKWFRIRKLTPRECFRLMDVSDTDFDKLIVTEDAGGKQKRAISDSQLYKMAGNSIVVSCMDLIFENLFFPAKSESTLF